MAEWILILTMMSADGHAITSVRGFQTETLCKKAGTAWLKQMNQASRIRYGGPSALCVQAAEESKKK